MPAATGEHRLDPLAHTPDGSPVGVVVLVDHLERPPALDHVASDELGPDLRRPHRVARGIEFVGGLRQQLIGVTGELVEVVQAATRPLDPLHRFAERPERTNGSVVEVAHIAGFVTVRGVRAVPHGTCGRVEFGVARVSARTHVERIDVRVTPHGEPSTPSGLRPKPVSGVGAAGYGARVDDDQNLITSDADGRRAPFVPSDNTTLSSVLVGLEREGYAGQFVASEDGSLRCGACGVESPAGTYAVETIRRLEGASEPDEMMSVVAAACPNCGAQGTAVLGYGPAASPEDAAVSLALPHVDP